MSLDFLVSESPFPLPFLPLLVLILILRLSGYPRRTAACGDGRIWRVHFLERELPRRSASAALRDSHLLLLHLARLGALVPRFPHLLQTCGEHLPFVVLRTLGSTPSRADAKESVNEWLGIEIPQVIDPLPHPDELHRQTQIPRNGNDTPPPRAPVQLGKDETRESDLLVPLPRGVQGHPPLRRVNDEESLVGDVLIVQRPPLVVLRHAEPLLYDPLHLGQLGRERVVVAEPSRRVDNNRIVTAREGEIEAAVQDGGGTFLRFVRGEAVDLGAVGPHLQLLHGARAEGVTCGDEDLLTTLVAEAGRELPDSGGLAHAIGTHDEEHCRQPALSHTLPLLEPDIPAHSHGGLFLRHLQRLDELPPQHAPEVVPAEYLG
mmetsp:Transcript_49495/g.149170  ORF Transcript_49495/g.149170 Transcript_49495/m.149170 type:complete len:376 (-) Transcript_49495:664-1791(-)